MRRGRRLLALAIAMGTATQSQGAEMNVQFDQFEVGKPPPRFSSALTGKGGPPVWIVQADPLPAGTGNVLMQTSTDATSDRFPLCIADGFSARDLDLSVRFAPMSGTVDRAGGLVWRYRDADNYYIARANALEGNVVLYKVEDGKRTDLKPIDSGLFAYGVKTEVPSGAWSELRISARGTRFGVWFNGKHLFDVDDATFANAGQIGVWTKADSVTAFDDLRAVSKDSE